MVDAQSSLEMGDQAEAGPLPVPHSYIASPSSLCSSTGCHGSISFINDRPTNPHPGWDSAEPNLRQGLTLAHFIGGDVEAHEVEERGSQPQVWA